MKVRRGLFLPVGAACLAMLAGCSDDVPQAETGEETEIPEEIRETSNRAVQPEGQVEGATPMEERVATIGVLNKRNNATRDIELTPGEQQRLGNIIVGLSACERTAPWETQRETGAFVQVMVRNPNAENTDFQRIFSGWLFKNSPSLNVVEHPIYDVWVKDCAMSFPGEEA